MKEYIQFLNAPLSSWNGWTLISFIVLLIGAKFIVNFFYLFLISLFGALGLAFHTLTDPTKSRFIAFLQAPIVFLSTIFFSIIACAIGALFFSLGVTTPNTQNAPNRPSPSPNIPNMPTQQKNPFPQNMPIESPQNPFN